MTEAEWLACTDPLDMVNAVGDRLTERKLRLFLVACCRRLSQVLKERRLREAVETAERFAEGLYGEQELDEAARSACVPRQGQPPPWLAEADRAAARACSYPGYLGARTHSFTGRYQKWSYGVMRGVDAAAQTVAYRASMAEEGERALADELKAQCRVLRDIAGNPYRPVRVDARWLAWNGGCMAALAAAAYEERRLPAGTLDAGRLAVLADALEEAGCDDAEVLSHLRGPGPHARGCHILDLLLGKE
jgi:hypothetical protein